MFNIFNLFPTTFKFKQLQKLNNNIIILVTFSKKILLYEKDKLIKEFYHPYFDLDISNIIFSKDSNLIAFNEKENIHIIDISSEQLVQTIRFDSTTIEFLKFDLESRYIFVMSSNIFYRYKYNSKYPLSKKKFLKNSKISVICFSKKDIVMGCEDGSIYIYNFNSKLNDKIIKNNSSKINALYYFNDLILLSGNDKGDIYIHNTDKTIKKIETGFTKIKQIVRLPETNYIFVVGDSNYLSVYDVNSVKLVSSTYIKFESKIDKIEIIDRYNIFVLLNTGFIKRVVLENLLDLNDLIVNNLLVEAFLVVEKDAILKDSDEYKKIEHKYKDIHNEAIKYLIKTNYDKALEMLEPFKKIESKKQKIKQLFNAFKYYERFKILVIEEKYLIAYSMCHKFKDLQQTPEYYQMENRFKSIFKNAQQLMIYGDTDKAETILSKFIIVTQKRDIIKLMLNHNNYFIDLLKAIESDDFKTIYKIIKIDKTFLKIYDINSVENKIKLILQNIQNNIKILNVENIYKDIDKLRGIDNLKLKLFNLLKNCKVIEKLKDAYEKDDFISCYELLDKNIFLNSVELSSFLDKHWQKIIYKCEDLALMGNFKEVKKILGELIFIKTRRDKIGDLLRICFYVQIDILKTEQKYKQSENLIYSYIDIFGLDEEIKVVMRQYEVDLKIKLAITDNQIKKVDKDSWIDSELIMGDLLHHSDDSASSIIKFIN